MRQARHPQYYEKKKYDDLFITICFHFCKRSIFVFGVFLEIKSFENNGIPSFIQNFHKYNTVPNIIYPNR